MAATPLILPAGLTVSTEGGLLNLRFEGDLVLRSTLGLAPDAVQRIEATGDLDLQTEVTSGTIHAGGALRVAGTLRAEASCGGNLEVGGDLLATASVGGAAVIRGGIAAPLRAEGSVQAAALHSGGVESGGDLLIEADAAGGDLRAAGRLRIGGNVDAGALRAREILLGDAEIKARSIAATERIEIGAARLTVDVILAPEVRVASAANGRVTVIESRNERVPTKIKGGFSVEDYEEMMGGAEAFLSERGVHPLPPRDPADATAASTAAPAEPAHAPQGPPASITASEGAPQAEEVPPEEEPSNPDAWLTDGEHTEEVGAQAPSSEDVDDPISLSVEDIEMMEEVDETAERMREAVRRLRSSYPSEAELPDFVRTVQGWVAQSDRAALANGLPGLWNALLDEHVAVGTRPHHQVTHAFNLLHSVVQSLPADRV